MNCALWSSEVFEDDDGALKNVHTAVLRGKLLVGRLPLFVVVVVVGKFHLPFDNQSCSFLFV